jgi:hypothetical protein
MAELPCGSCISKTKYVCISCKIPICNRKDCSFAENNESISGWIAQRSVGYCKECENIKNGESSGLGSKRVLGKRRGQSEVCNKIISDKDFLESQSDVGNSTDESDQDKLFEISKRAKRKAKGPKGRRRAWKDSHIDDMIDIIVNNEKYKKKLIFTNVKKQKIVRYMKVF